MHVSVVVSVLSSLFQYTPPQLNESHSNKARAIKFLTSKGADQYECSPENAFHSTEATRICNINFKFTRNALKQYFKHN